MIHIFFFTTSNLHNWEGNTKGLREDPEGFLNLIRSIFQIDNPSGQCAGSLKHWGHSAAPNTESGRAPADNVGKE